MRSDRDVCWIAAKERKLASADLLARMACVRPRLQPAGEPKQSRVRHENGRDAYNEILAKLRCTLEKGGVVFVEGNGEGPGVRLMTQL